MLESGEISSFEYPRIHFNDIFASIVSVFILILGEDWNFTMNGLTRVMDVSFGRALWVPQAYCIFGVLFGNLTLLALFTGILIQAFQEENSNKIA